MLFLLHHDSEMTPLLAGRQARWVGIAPQSCSASREAQAVAWFSVMEIKDKDSATNKGQSAELCPVPALLQLQKETLGKSAPLQLFPRTAFLLRADFVTEVCKALWSPGWAEVHC